MTADENDLIWLLGSLQIGDDIKTLDIWQRLRGHHESHANSAAPGQPGDHVCVF